MHIKSKFIKTPDLEWDFSITDFAIFDENGLLREVEKAWCATKELSIRLDSAQSDELANLDAYLLHLDELMKREPAAEEDYVMAIGALGVSQACNAVFVPAVIFMLQISFVEFALKRVCCALDPNFKPPSKGIIAACTGFLKREKVIQQIPREFEKWISGKIDVRNDFAHGDWLALSKKLEQIDLFRVFEAVAMCLYLIKEGLQSRGYEV